MSSRCSLRLPQCAAVAFVTFALMPAAPGFGQPPAQTAPHQDELLRTIHTAWKIRTERFQRFRIRYAKTQKTESGPQQIPGVRIEARAESERPTVRTTVAEMVMDASQARINERPGDESNSEIDGQNRQGISQSSHSEIDEGASGSTLVTTPQVADHELLLLAMRPFDFQGQTRSIDKYRIVDGEAKLNGRRAVRLEGSSPNDGNIRHVMWVDPMMDYVIIQHDSTVDGKLRSRYQIAYHQDSPVVPSEWSYQLVAVNGASTVTVQAKQLQFEAHPAISTANFHPATWPDIGERNPQTTTRAGAANGDRRYEVTSKETTHGVGHSNLMEGEFPSSPAAAGGNRILKRWFILFIANVVGMALVSGLVVLFRRWRA